MEVEQTNTDYTWYYKYEIRSFFPSVTLKLLKREQALCWGKKHKTTKRETSCFQFDFDVVARFVH